MNPIDFADYFFSVLAAEKEEDSTAKCESGTRSAQEIPEGKKQTWESLQKMVYNEYNVCLEYCGNSIDCLDRCEKAYKIRLDREYKALMLE